MITRITGVVNRVIDEEVRLQVGALEYQVLVPEFVRRKNVVLERLRARGVYGFRYVADREFPSDRVAQRLV